MLTDTRLRILKEIHSYIKENAYGPTIRELCSIVDLRSTGTVHNHLSRLEEAGYIERREASPRALKITAKGINVILEG